MSQKLSEDQAALLGSALLRLLIAQAVALTLTILAAFVFDSNVLRGLAVFFWLVALAHLLFIRRRQARLSLRENETLPHGRRTLAPLWAGAAISAGLLLALPKGTWTIVFGIASFLFLSAASRLTGRGPRGNRW